MLRPARQQAEEHMGSGWSVGGHAVTIHWMNSRVKARLIFGHSGHIATISNLRSSWNGPAMNRGGMGFTDTLKSMFSKGKSLFHAHSEDLDNAIEKGVDKAKDAVEPHTDKIGDAIDTAADKVDDATKGKASGMVDKFGKKNP
jgi:hypothetical protein